MKKLRKMERGTTYTIVYLKMQLASLRNNGILTFDHLDDNFVEELACEIDEDPGDVSATVEFLLRCNLLIELSEAERYLPDVVKNTGSEGASAQRMRELRARGERGMSHCDDTSSLRYGKKTIKNYNQIIKSECVAPPAPQPHTLSVAQNPGSGFVPLTVEDVAEYVASYGGRVIAQVWVDYYAARGWMMGKTVMKDWKTAVRMAESWERWDKPVNRSEVRTPSDYEGGESFV